MTGIRHEPAGDDAARIVIEGLARDLRILHLTDSHLVAGDERDPQAAEHVTSCRQRFAERTPGGVPARQVFEDTLREAGTLDLDAAVLTGDIIHFPTYAALEVVDVGLQRLGVPSLYIPGNHDWHFPYLEWSEATRAEYYPRFHGLAGRDPACQALQLPGVRLIALDNSTYQVSESQVAFLRRQLAAGEPSLLFLHIPIWVDSLMPAVLEAWQAPIVMGAPSGWTPETRARWKVGEATPGTTALQALLAGDESDNLAAIFCGHVHLAHVDAWREDRWQYVTAPGFGGSYRVIELAGR